MTTRLQQLMDLMATLRAPDGCPWDRKQTHESLKPYLLEEAYEVLEAIDQKDASRLREELGDLLLQVVFHAQLAAERGRFSLEDIIDSLSDKLIRRHPHVFGTTEQKAEPLGAEDVKVRWEQIKRGERERNGRAGSLLDGVPQALPALLRAYQVQARVARVGFDWPELGPVLEKLEEELQEFRHALDAACDGDAVQHGAAQEALESELGDVFFTLVNVARRVKVNPEEALRKTVNRFLARFHYMEAQAATAGRPLDELSLAEMDELWRAAKRHLADVGRREEPRDRDGRHE